MVITGTGAWDAGSVDVSGVWRWLQALNSGATDGKTP